jgi:galactokinase
MELYGKDHIRQQIRYKAAIRAFDSFAPGEDFDYFYSAPGRTELCGNHTHHNNGKVLAAAINLDTIALVKKTETKEVIIYSKGYGEVRIDLTDLRVNENQFGVPQELIRGVASEFAENGYNIGGFTAYMESNIIAESGLAFAVSFEILLGTIFSDLYNDGKISDMRLAKIGRDAEFKYYGRPSGLLDQTAIVTGGVTKMDFFDTENPIVIKTDFSMQATGYQICITDTRGEYANLAATYAAIPHEMKSIAESFHGKTLRDITKDEVLSRASYVRRIFGDRAFLRAMHYFDENVRVEKAVEALNNNDFEAFLAIIKASGDSSYKLIQNIYPSGNPAAQGIAIGLYMSEQILDGRGVSRVHGGGFAGTIQCYLPSEMTEEYIMKMEAIFGLGCCHLINFRNYGGVRVDYKHGN